jgi:hypothetical protein
MSVLGTYQGASTIMRKALDWTLTYDSDFGLDHLVHRKVASSIPDEVIF